MAKKTKQFLWHKKRGKMLSSKYLRERKGNPPVSGHHKEQKSAEDTPTKRFARHLDKVIKKTVRGK